MVDEKYRPQQYPQLIWHFVCIKSEKKERKLQNSFFRDFRRHLGLSERKKNQSNLNIFTSNET